MSKKKDDVVIETPELAYWKEHKNKTENAILLLERDLKFLPFAIEAHKESLAVAVRKLAELENAP